MCRGLKSLCYNMSGLRIAEAGGGPDDASYDSCGMMMTMMHQWAL